MSTRSVHRGIALFCAAFWVSFGGIQANAAPVSARLMQLLGSEAGLGLLRESTTGNELMLRLLGRRLKDGRDLGELRKRLEKPDADTLRGELESRLEHAESEYDTANRALPMSTSLRERLFEELSSRWLKFQAVGTGQIEFVDAAVGAGTYASSRAAMGGLRLATTSLGTTLESAIPVEAGSMVERLGPQLYDELIGIENRFIHENGLDSPDGIAKALQANGSGTVTLKDMLDYIVVARQKMSEELKLLGARYRSADPLLAETLEKAAHEVGLSQHALGNVAERAPVLASETYTGGQSADGIMDYVHKLRGEMGELKVAVRVKGLVGRGLKIEDLGVFFGKGPVADAARARLHALKPQYPQYIGKELDLILDGGMLWGEVKNYGGVFSSQHRFYTKVMEQAQHTVEIRDLLERDPEIGAALKALGKKITFRIYLIGGVTESAAKTLEGMGFEVYGPRYLDGAAGAMCVMPAAGDSLMEQLSA